MSDREFKLFEDRYGVRHWRYPFTAVLLLCGKEQFHNSGGLDVDTYPTCLWCIHVLARDEGQ
jgi:hypothetical protein